MRTTKRSISCGLALSILAGAQASAARDIDEQAVARWADASFQQALAQQRFTGAVISVVKDGKVILSKGYGHADREAGTPMDPAQTRVRICSVSKTIVATALMQLVDRGVIASLDDPANKYLKRIQLPSYEGQQITLRHLTTHSAGFEDSFFNAGTVEIVPTPVDAATLQRLIPRIVRKPGSLSVYSNATLALQGVLIEDVTGLTLRDYLAQHIFTPLGMTRTALNDNPPAPPGAARPYILYSDASVRPVEIVAKHPVYAPSGGVYSTAEDMSRFVAAHLDAGRTAAPLLSRAAFETMHTPFRRNHPGVGGLGVQFFIDDINGERVINHGCGLPGFTSYIVLLPARGVGVFLSVISARGHEPLALLRCCGGQPAEPIAPNFAVRFFYDFLQEFVGYGELPRAALAADLERYVGDYRPERRVHTNILAALDLLSPVNSVVPIRLGEDGALAIGERGPFRSYRAGMLQRDMHPARIYAFDLDADGRATRMMWSSAQAATRVGYWQNPAQAHRLLLILSIVLATGLIALAWPTGDSSSARRARWLPLLVVAALAAVWVAAKVGFPGEESIEEYINIGHTARLFAIATLCNLIALAALAMGLATVGSWRRGYWGPGFRGAARRAHFTVLALAALLFIPVFAVFNLLGWQIP